MRYLPLTVSTPLIPSLLDDSKLVTRRILPDRDQKLLSELLDRIPEAEIQCSRYANGVYVWQATDPNRGHILLTLSRGYQPGDILWVREEHYAFGFWGENENEFTKNGRPKKVFCRMMPGHADFDSKNLYYPDTFPARLTLKEGHGKATGYYKRLARFMPKEYARTFLEIEDVHIERLNTITEEDARLEGMKPNLTAIMAIGGQPALAVAHQAMFIRTWERLHGKDAWLRNDFVYRIKFRRIPKPKNFTA